MKFLVGTLVALALIVTVPAFAEKPASAGKGKRTDEQVKARGNEMKAEASDLAKEAKENAEKEREQIRDRIREAEKGKDEQAERGLEEQRELKQEQVRKELGKGSEKGQASREEHSRKWWRFWE